MELTIEEKIKTSLRQIEKKAGINLQFREFSGQVLMVKYTSKKITCAITSGSSGPPEHEKEMVLEVLEDFLKKEFPEIKRIIVE